MYHTYLLTGATGFLGRAVIAELLRAGRRVKALVLETDPLMQALPDGVEIVRGDVCRERSLEPLFAEADSGTCVIHCAGMVSVASRPGDLIYRVNVGGTGHMLRYSEKYGVGRFVYVSSVHAIPEKPNGVVMDENTLFAPEKVRGDYAKSKAIATSLVLGAAERGLHASVVFPSGLIGPGDTAKGSITHMLCSFLTCKMPFAVRGGYDFADVRDVAAGIVACTEHGKPGRGYILSGHYAQIRDLLDLAGEKANISRRPLYLPLALAHLFAPCAEKRALRKKRPLYFTPQSIEVLGSNGRFDRSAAAIGLGYAVRPLRDSVCDMVDWILENKI